MCDAHVRAIRRKAQAELIDGMVVEAKQILHRKTIALAKAIGIGQAKNGAGSSDAIEFVQNRGPVVAHNECAHEAAIDHAERAIREWEWFARICLYKFHIVLALFSGT